MHKNIWICDGCGIKRDDDDSPNDWYDLEITRGENLLKDNLLVDALCCSKDCLLKVIKNSKLTESEILESKVHFFYSNSHT